MLWSLLGSFTRLFMLWFHQNFMNSTNLIMCCLKSKLFFLGFMEGWPKLSYFNAIHWYCTFQLQSTSVTLDQFHYWKQWSYNWEALESLTNSCSLHPCVVNNYYDLHVTDRGNEGEMSKPRVSLLASNFGCISFWIPQFQLLGQVLNKNRFLKVDSWGVS